MSATISTADRRRGAIDAVDRLVNSERSVHDVLQQTVELLRVRFDHYSWVGVYLVDGRELVLEAWSGPSATEHVRIPVGQGICGAAAASGVTEIVDDVGADDRYLACFASTRSEIVVPIHSGDEVVGEIDIDSDVAAAFDEDDRLFLEQVARLLATCRRS